jgi:hypothetical protein
MNNQENLPPVFAVVNNGKYDVYKCVSRKMVDLSVNVVNLETGVFIDKATPVKIARKGNKHLSLARKNEDKVFGQVVWSYIPEVINIKNISSGTELDSIPVINLKPKRGGEF